MGWEWICLGIDVVPSRDFRILEGFSRPGFRSLRVPTRAVDSPPLARGDISPNQHGAFASALASAFDLNVFLFSVFQTAGLGLLMR